MWYDYKIRVRKGRDRVASPGKKPLLTVRETVIFALLGALLFVSKLLMEWAPNVHPLAFLILTYTAVYRAKALFPVYLFVLLEGIVAGFSLWWVPYVYLWLVLWAAGMLVPARWSNKVKIPVYALIAALHGLAYGTLYAPFQALAFRLDFRATVAWVLAGLPWDAVHAAGNLVFGLLVVPAAGLLKKLAKMHD